MPADKPRPTLADYVTIVISPALIIVMIVSLIFFLLSILYRGEFGNRLHVIFFFFTFGIVLVARIAMEDGHSERAPIYGAVLGILAWLGMRNFVEYPPELVGPSWIINAGLVGLASWLAYQLTHSCTYIDEKAESTGTGVLQAAGLEKSPSANDVEQKAEADQAPENNGKRKKKEPRQPSWWARYERFREARKKSQPPGVWVVYFALAALPIFGLGQALIDVTDVERRSAGFRLMMLYAMSSLGLLVTTAFLGLRRYLRQRRLEMPKLVTSAWLVLGAGLVGALVFIGALLPRPQSEYSLLKIGGAGGQEHAASKYAASNGEPGKGPGRPGAQEDDPNGAPTDSKNDKHQGKGGKGKAKGQGGSDKQNQQSANKAEKKAGDKRDSSSEKSGDGGSESSPDSKPQLPELGKVARALKWIVFGILALATVFFVLRGGLKYLANFCDWARRLLDALRRFWEGLWGGTTGGPAPTDRDNEMSRAARAPFDAFSNPFQSGRDKIMTPVELVRYSFEALEAWSEERACGRGTEETPIEFTNRLAEEIGGLDRETQQLGISCACVLYARGGLPSDWRSNLETFWERLARIAHKG